MKTKYILRKKNEDIIYFYYLNKNILYKIYRNNTWSEENILIQNTLDKFTITMLEEEIYIFYQNINGDIILYNTDINFYNNTNKLILKKQNKNFYNMFFYPIINKNNMCILYNISNLDRSWKIITQAFSKDSLLPSREIDNVFPTASCVFQIQYISSGHLLLFYKLRSLENNIGYKEITVDKTSNFISLYKSNLPIVDYYFIATESNIHSLCVLQNLFSYQLIYKNKENNTISKPIIIFEGNKISNCLISIVNKDIYITFICQNNLYLSISKDNGKTFSKSEIFKNDCSKIEIASYISEEYMNINNLFIKETYINKLDFYNINIYYDLYKNNLNNYENTNKNTDILNNNLNENLENIENKTYTNSNIENNYENENKEIENLKIIINEKDEQIEYMKNIIKKYKEEKSDFNLEQINVKNNYLKEIENLKNKILILENLNKKLESSKNKKIQPQNKNNKNRYIERNKKK